ncbi:MAG: pyridoxal 5'-phosphate synthase lyase subunit PdxS [Sarcina sp.]
MEKIFCEITENLIGKVIMDVTTVEEAKIAQEAGAGAVMALERVPSDIRKEGGVARMSDPYMIKQIQNAVSIPVMAKARIGHFVEAQLLEAINIDFIDESEVLTPADDKYHINKKEFTSPFVCGARNLREALRRINEGAKMIRTKGEAGTGDIVEAVRHMRTMNQDIASLKELSNKKLTELSTEYQIPFELLEYVKINQKLPVVNFAAGGVATPADAALMMQLGCDGVFVGSGIFRSENPAKRAKAIVLAVEKYSDKETIAEVSMNLGKCLDSIPCSSLEVTYAHR